MAIKKIKLEAQDMEIEIMSKTCIPPSSPTPLHLKTHKISLLDQSQPTWYIPTIIFYPNSRETNIISEKSELLKQSLSQVLSRFYPLAGKIKDRFHIDCNDEGLCYTEAKSNISLSDYLTQPDLMLLNKLMPNASRDYDLPDGSPVALIQETTFTCGGFTIGMYISHMVCDLKSSSLFLRDWAAATAAVATANTAKFSAKKGPPPPFVAGDSIFPQIAAFPKEAKSASIFAPFLKQGKYITKRIVFSESAIAELKSKAASSNKISNPTRVEVVTAILGKSLISSFKNRTGIENPLAINHVVNLRQKMESPLPETFWGNSIRPVGAVFRSKDDELGEVVSKLREAIKKIDNEFVTKLRSSEDGFPTIFNAMKEIKDLFASSVGEGGAMEFAMFSSWCNFGIYNIDFGWGKPIWAACNVLFEKELYLPQPNLILLMDTRIGKGVEAWVALDEDDFKLFEKDVLLLQYASIDPSPLEIA